MIAMRCNATRGCRGIVELPPCHECGGSGCDECNGDGALAPDGSAIDAGDIVCPRCAENDLMDATSAWADISTTD